VPGALSNQPPAPATAPLTVPPLPGANAAGSAGAAPATTRKDSSINYELDKSIKYVQQPMGGIKRLSVAIVVNYKMTPDKKGVMTPRALTDQEKAQITDLAKEAMGFKKERGDTLNVVNSPFAGTEKELIVETPFLKKAEVYLLSNLAEIGKVALAVIVLVYLFFGHMRPLLKKLATRSTAPVHDAGAGAGAGADTDASASATGASSDAALPSGRTYEEKLMTARQTAKENPRVVANVVKAWVNGNE
jgi:flagellar M-ring protein FliF